MVAGWDVFAAATLHSFVTVSCAKAYQCDSLLALPAAAPWWCQCGSCTEEADMAYTCPQSTLNQSNGACESLTRPSEPTGKCGPFTPFILLVDAAVTSNDWELGAGGGRLRAVHMMC